MSEVSIAGTWSSCKFDQTPSHRVHTAPYAAAAGEWAMNQPALLGMMKQTPNILRPPTRVSTRLCSPEHGGQEEKKEEEEDVMFQQVV